MRKIIKNFSIGTILFILLVLSGTGLYAAFFRGSGNTYEEVPVIHRDIQREVSVTGTVIPFESVTVGFERSGRVENICSRWGICTKR